MAASLGRVIVEVERGRGSITLRLAQWQLKHDATLTISEAREVAAMITRAVDAAEPEQDDSDLA